MELIARSNAGIEVGINDDGDLFLGDDKSGYNLPLTRKNVDRVVSDFNRYLDADETKLTADSFKEYIQDDEDEEVEESINIRQSLLNIDKDTDNEYDLCTLYESLQLNDNEKRDVVKMLKSKTSPSDIYECLNNKLVNETWSYKGMENNNMKIVNEAKRRAHVFDDLVDEITTRLANKGMRSDTDKYLGIYDETTSSDDADGKFRMEIGELKFDYDKKTEDHVIIVQPEEDSPRDLSFARSIAREYAQEGVRVEEKKHNGKDAIFFYIPEDAEPFDHPAPEFKGRGEYLKKVTPWIEKREYVELEKQYNDKLIDIFKEEGWEDPQRVVDGDKVSITFKDDDGYVYDYTTDHKSELIDLYKKQNKIDDFARYMYEVAFEQADMKEPEDTEMKESLNQYQLTDKVTEYVDDDDVIAYEKIARVLRTNLDNLYVVEDDSYDYDPQFLDRSGRRVAGIEAFKYEVNGIPVVRERASGGLRMYFRNSDDAEKYVEYVKEENGLTEDYTDAPYWLIGMSDGHSSVGSDTNIPCYYKLRSKQIDLANQVLKRKGIDRVYLLTASAFDNMPSDDIDKQDKYIKQVGTIIASKDMDESIVSSNWRSDDDNEDETTYNYDDELIMDLDDDAVHVGKTFIEDGHEWKWIKQVSNTEHIDFDNWAVWFATDVDTQDGGYFIVDIDTGFIDWGPVDSEEEAKEFLQDKVDDYSREQYPYLKDRGYDVDDEGEPYEESINVEDDPADEANDIASYLEQFMMNKDFENNKYFDEYDRQAIKDTYDALTDYAAEKYDEFITDLDEDIDLSDYKEVDGGSGYWELYRKFKPGMKKAEWVAKNQNTGEIRKISYKQATGEDPIEDSAVKRLARDVGKKLLPSKLEGVEDLSTEQVNTLKEMGSIIVSDIEKEAKKLQRSFIALNRCLQRANVPVTNIEETIMYHLSELLKNSSDDTVTVSDLKEYVNKIQ